MPDRNLLLAFVLSFLVLYGWTRWQASLQPPEPPPGAEQAAGGAEAASGTEAEPAATKGRRVADLPAAGAEMPPPAGTEAPSGESAEAAPSEPGRQIRVDQPLYEAVLDTRGGALDAWVLKTYTDAYGEPVALVDASEGSAAVAATPFAGLGQGDLSRVAWDVASRDVDEIVFALERGGVRLRKTWSFSDDDYAFRLRLDVENTSAAAVAPRFLVDWPAHARPERDFAQQAFAVLHDGKVKQTPIARLGRAGFLGLGGPPPERIDYLGEIDWAGVKNTYFVSALLPDSPNQASARIAVIEPSVRGSLGVFFDPVEIPPGQTLTREFRGYIGPKEMERLEAMGGGIDRSVDLGWSWFTPLTRAFGWLLQVLYGFVPNYGVAIILLTIMVRGVTAPLTLKQMRSMERMRRVQPRMKEIQEKYADDRQRQSEEMMRLYRAEKVNPLGGCLPMLLQLPVFIGLFYALRSSIQLRHAPFFGWIHDLSAPEVLFTLPGIGIPVRLLPLIMGVTMFFQQKITPMQTPDPTQARMMQTVMPVMMTVLFYQFASGLVLYWMMSNLLAIAHQLWIGRRMGPPQAA